MNEALHRWHRAWIILHGPFIPSGAMDEFNEACRNLADHMVACEARGEEPSGDGNE